MIAHRKRRIPPRITITRDTDPTLTVCLREAAKFLDVNERTVRARIERGMLPALQDGKIYRITVADLRAYDAHRQRVIVARGTPRSATST